MKRSATDLPDLAMLLAQVARGDRKAMTELYEATAPVLHGIAAAITRDSTAAAQLTESAYLRVWDRAPRFDPAASEAHAWLAAIARNGAVEWRRRVPGPSAFADAEILLSDETLLTGEAPVGWDTAATLLHYRLRALPVDEQAAIRVALLTGATHSEIAQAALANPATIERRIADGLAVLARESGITASNESALARALALGTLEGSARAAALRKQLSDPGFAAEVEDWQLHLAPMLEALAPAEPPAELRARIEALIDLREADAPRRARRLMVRWPLGQATAIGLAAALAGALAAMAIFIFALGGLQPRPPGAAPVLIAQMAGQDRRPDLAIRYDPVGSAIRVRARRLDPAQGVADLWLLATDGTPHFLGRVTGNGVDRFPLPRTTQQLITDGATVMVTVVPADQARRSEPSGKVVASARFVLV